MASNEHKEVIKKEFSKWIDDVCRICQHKRLFHVIYSEKNLAPKLETGYTHANCNFVMREGFCNCSEWQSPDNLDYIELLAKRRGLVPDDEDTI